MLAVTFARPPGHDIELKLANARSALAQAIERLIDALDLLSPDADLELACEDEGAQCDDEGYDGTPIYSPWSAGC